MREFDLIHNGITHHGTVEELQFNFRGNADNPNGFCHLIVSEPSTRMDGDPVVVFRNLPNVGPEEITASLAAQRIA